MNRSKHKTSAGHKDIQHPFSFILYFLHRTPGKDILGIHSSSPDMYQDLIKPRLVKLIRFIKNKKPDVKMMMHSCGAIFKIIPDLIDAGVEILNPLQ